MSKMGLEASKALILTSRRGRWGSYQTFGYKGDKTVSSRKKSI